MLAGAAAAPSCQLGDGSKKIACATDGDCNPGRFCAPAGMCVPGIQTAALGFEHSCVLRQSGAVQCWGNNASGESGGTAPLVLLPLVPGTLLSEILDGPASALDVGNGFGCALMATGKVECWGRNVTGQLGQGPGAASPGTADLGTGYHAVALGVGQDSACAVLTGGSVKCWGQNDLAELGLGDLVNRGDQADQMGDNLKAVQLGGGHTARAVVVGDSHACALLDDFQVACWGDNYWGQLGLEDTVTRGDSLHPLTDSTAVAALGSIGHAVALSAGGDHTCALLDGGQVKCWGANSSGELGIGVNESGWGDQPGEMGNNLPAVDLGAGRTAIAVAAGEGHSCAILDDHGLKCWGLNDAGQLGLDSYTNLGSSPTDMGDNLPAVQLGAGRFAIAVAAGGHHTCAVLDDHRIKCWGRNDKGQVGLEDLHNDYGDGLVGVTDVAAMEMGDSLPFVDLGP